MRLPRLAAAAAGAGLAALAAAPAAHAAALPAAVLSAPGYSVPMHPGPAPHGYPPPALPTGDQLEQFAEHYSAVPYLHLSTSVSGPEFGDDYNVMYYSFDVTNSPESQTTATGIAVRMTMLACTSKDEPDSLCKQEKAFTEHIGALAPGKSYNGAIPVDLPNNQPELWLRFAPEISHVDQLILGNAPGTCIYGLHASDLCATTTDDLQP
jgi:hypothetical protein